MLFSNNRWHQCCFVILLIGIISLMPLTAYADSLKVVVQDQNGNPVPSANVVIGTEEKTTDDNGAAMFDDVSGVEPVQITALGFSSSRVNVTTGQEELTVTLAPLQTIESVVVVGTRSIGRRALQAPVPIEVVEQEQLSLTGQSETGRILQMLVPSFNFPSSSISDGTDALRTCNFAGIRSGPDFSACEWETPSQECITSRKHICWTRYRWNRFQRDTFFSYQED